jgi:hypothetical protein
MSYPRTGGRLPRDPSAPFVELTPHLLEGRGNAPSKCDWHSLVQAWGVELNNKWGCCTCSGDGHIAIQQTLYGFNQVLNVTDADVLAAYVTVGGFNPHMGPPGDNPTDKGATVQQALHYLQAHGIAGFRIAAFGEVYRLDHEAVKQAIFEFGALSLGMNFPKSAMDQFNAGAPWTPVPGAELDGGHCVIAVGYDDDWVYVVTWGQVVKMSWAFWDEYVEESWAVISPAWRGVSGLDLSKFAGEWHAMFGGRNPFNPPPPAPIRVIENDVSAVARYFRRIFYRGAHIG